MVASPRWHPIGAPGDYLTGVEFDEASAQARQVGGKGAPRGGIVDTVDPGSPCEIAGVRPGDGVLRVNGRKLRDAVDYQFFTADEPRLEFEVASHVDHRVRSVVVERDVEETPGISFTEPTFSPIRECNNHCPFCFIDQ